MSYKNLEDRKVRDQRYHISNRVERLAYMKERRRLIKEGRFEKKEPKGKVRKDKNEPSLKAVDVAVEVEELKPGQRGYINPEVYSKIEPLVDGLSEDAAPPSVEEKKKPGMKVESQDEEAEKMSDDLNEVFDE